MAKKRMRYRWWTARPRNVSQQEFDRLGLLNGAAVITGVLSVFSLLFGLSGATLRTSQDLAEIDTLSVAEAVNHSGEALELVKIEGFLVADDAPVMPDDDALTVIEGQITLIARAMTRGGSSDEDENGEPSSSARREILYEWQGAADQVFLSDGDDARIPLGFDLAKLPVPEAPVSFDQEPNVEKSGGARVSRPTAVAYGGQVFPLDPDTWGTRSVAVDLERRALPYGQTALIVAGLEPTPEGNQLIDPLGNRLKIFLMTEAELQENNQESRRMMLIIWIPLAIASVFLTRSARRYYEELVEISNEP